MLPEDLIDESTLRRQIELSYRFRRHDGCITAVFPIGVIDAGIWYDVAYGRKELCSGGLSHKDLKKYLEIREFPDSEGTHIVNSNKIYETVKAAVVPVRSRTAPPAKSLDNKEWKRDQFHYVEARNIPKKGASEHEKNILARNLIVQCPCGGNPIARIMSPRNSSPLPDRRVPYVDSIVDLHGSVALFHLPTLGFESYIWKFIPTTVRVVQKIVRRQLKVGKKIPNDMMNSYILKNAISLFKPLERRIHLKKIN